MKKITALMIAVIMILSLAGCESSPTAMIKNKSFSKSEKTQVTHVVKDKPLGRDTDIVKNVPVTHKTFDNPVKIHKY